MVIGIRQRGGPLRFIKVSDVKSGTLYDTIEKHVDGTVERIVTDEFPAYNFELTQFRGKHKRIKHAEAQAYVVGDIHTNTIESAFSLLKRGIIGSFHKVSIKHLQRYLNEFQYRFNRRKSAAVFEETLRRMASIQQMEYKVLIAEA